ncbi:class I SAM-dependent methyltransferase [Nocardioides luteus]|uniref:Methyltransferase domain-containing protein n=1 Tax=Nocardioides luteus TaxID=1844 RepID=A0ABQ5T2X8_9ACTN|nr:hypothetical protein GCM10010197_19080 [Nocardioides luteus]GLJ69824.1 hypothetical protein GCM10017579_38600 [Nocardioides luteus]
MTTTEIGAAYDGRAAEYIDLLGSVEDLAQRDRDTIATWRDGTDGSLLDAGCGPGHWSRELAQDGVRDVVGLDASAEFVAAARERFPDIPFHQGDLAAIPLADASVGGVLAWYSLIHTPPANLPTILAELARVLSPRRLGPDRLLRRRPRRAFRPRRPPGLLLVHRRPDRSPGPPRPHRDRLVHPPHPTSPPPSPPDSRPNPVTP